MPAVVDEQVDRPEFVEELWQATTARSPHQRPPPLQSLRDGGPCLVLEPRLIQYGWQVDAAQAAGPIGLQPFENHPRGESARDTGLDRGARAEVSGQTPGGPCEPGIGVVPAAVGMTTEAQSLASERADGVLPQRRE